MSERRTFIKKAALTGMAAGSMAAASSAKAAGRSSGSNKKIDPRVPFKRTSRYRDELVTIGMVGSRGGGHTS